MADRRALTRLLIAGALATGTLITAAGPVAADCISATVAVTGDYLMGPKQCIAPTPFEELNPPIGGGSASTVLIRVWLVTP